MGQHHEPARRTRRLLAALAALVVLVAGGIIVVHGRHRDPSPWHPALGGSGLVTNEWAYRHPDSPQARTSPDWRVTSGSLFDDNGRATGGRVDGASPGPDSAHATGSAVFRAVSRRRDLGDVRFGLDLRVHAISSTRRTPPQSYDGVHLFLRYHDHNQLYVVSLCRRDNSTAIKKKAPDASGKPVYTTLGTARLRCPRDVWQHFTATAQDNGNGVQISLAIGNRQVVTARDDGAGGAAPLLDPGAVGIRADNTAFLIRDVRADPLPPAGD